MPTYPSSINRQTVITFPLNNSMTDITTGIEAGSLYLNKVLFENQLHFGECHPDRFEVTLFGVDDDISQETIQVYQLDYTNDPNNPVRTNLFYGVVDSCLKEDNQVNRRLVALDPMYTIGNTDATDWWNTYWEGAFTSTTSALLTSLLSAFSVTLSSNSVTTLASLPTKDLSIMQFSGFQAITFGSVLAKITEILLCNAHFNAEGKLELISFGATYNRTSRTIDGEYEDANSHFEAFTTEPITKVVIYGETDEIAGEYGTGDNVYVIKGNPLLYNLTDTTYNALAQTVYEHLYNTTSQMAQAGICYTPANIKMIVSRPEIQLGDTILTTHGTSSDSSIVSSIELSGTMLVEQNIVSSGNLKLTPDDFDNTDSTAGRALEQATTTSRHFVWVPNEGAFVTTDDTPAGQAPTDNYTKLTEDGLYVTTNGEQVAHFGVDENDQPVSVLGSTAVENTSVIMSSSGILAGKQVTDNVKVDYFSVNVTDNDEMYRNINDLTLTVSGNRGYLQLPSTDTYKGVASLSYYCYDTLEGDVIVSLSHAKHGFDIAVDSLLDDIFSIVTGSLTDDSSLLSWFDAWFAVTQTVQRYHYIILLDNADEQIRCEFLDSNGDVVTYGNQAVYARLYFTLRNGFPTVYSLSYTNKLDISEYSYNLTNPYQIDIVNLSRYNVESPRDYLTFAQETPAYLEITSTLVDPIYFRPVMLIGNVAYRMTLGDSVVTNSGINSIVFGDGNTVTNDSQKGVVIIGEDNTVDNNEITETYVGTYVFGSDNTVEQHNAFVVGQNNSLTSSVNAENDMNNVVVGNGNTINNNSANSDFAENQIFGLNNTVSGLLNTVIGQDNSIAGSLNFALGRNLLLNSSASGSMVLGKYNASSSGVFIIGNGTATNARHNAMVVGNGVTLYPLQTNALIFDNGGTDRKLNMRYQNDAGGTNTNFIQMAPTASNYGIILGVGGNGLTVVGGGECVGTIVDDPSVINLTTASENLVMASDANLNFISNAGTVANHKKMTMGTDGLLQINECSGTGINLAYFDNSGKIKRDNRSFYAKGDSFSGWNLVGLGGYVTTSTKEVVVFLPMPFPPSLISTSGLTIKMTLRQNNTYPYIYNTPSQINGLTLVNNGTKVSGLSTVSFDSRSVSGMTLHLTFANALQKSASSTSNAIINNNPVGVALEISGSFVT